jgi:hypothetical protein
VSFAQSYGRLGHHPGELADAVERRAVSALAEFRAFELAHCLWGFAALGLLPEELLGALDAAPRRLPAIAHGVNASALVDIFWALACCQASHRSHFIVGRQAGRRLCWGAWMRLGRRPTL